MRSWNLLLVTLLTLGVLFCYKPASAQSITSKRFDLQSAYLNASQTPNRFFFYREQYGSGCPTTSCPPDPRTYSEYSIILGGQDGYVRRTILPSEAFNPNHHLLQSEVTTGPTTIRKYSIVIPLGKTEVLYTVTCSKTSTPYQPPVYVDAGWEISERPSGSSNYGSLITNGSFPPGTPCAQ